MIVGDDDAAGIDDEAGTERLDAARAPAFAFPVAVKELLEELLEGRAFRYFRDRDATRAGDSLRGGNIDHRILQALRQVGEGERLALRVRRRDQRAGKTKSDDRHGGHGHQPCR